MTKTEKSERKAFKLWFDEALARELAERLSAVEPQFHPGQFIEFACSGLDSLEMMERVGQFADALRRALPTPMETALAALVRSLPEVLESGDGVTEAGYRFWPYGEFIARHGLADFDASFHAMVELTMRFSSEFAVRPFLAAEPDRTLDRLEGLIEHPNVHVRRWVSEGTRSRLPWGKKVPALQAREERRLAILERLHRDSERYVLRSVANHLQDLLKDNRDLAFPTLARWAKEDHAGSNWVAKHAARGLLKACDPDALHLFGQHSAEIEVIAIKVSADTVRIGDFVVMTVQLTNSGDEPAEARVDYELRSPGANGRENRKVFRLGSAQLKSGEQTTMQGRHTFAHRTIRTVRPGVHRLVINLNGRHVGEMQVLVED